MQVEKHMHGNVTIITLDGTLDSGTAPGVQQDLGALMLDQSRVLLDLSRVSYMSSAGLRVLLLTYRQAQRIGARLALSCVPPDVHSVMEATGFLDFFSVAETVEDGLETLTA